MATNETVSRAARESASGTLSERHLAVLRHALGLSEDGPGEFRGGYYVLDPVDADAFALVGEVIRLGLMEEGAVDCDLPAFRVTPAGRLAVENEALPLGSDDGADIPDAIPPAGRGLYRFTFDAGRAGSLDGLFVSSRSDVAAAIGREVYFGEVLGKHSQVRGVLDADEIKLLTDDEPFIERAIELDIVPNGFNPLEYLVCPDESCRATSGDEHAIYCSAQPKPGEAR